MLSRLKLIFKTSIALFVLAILAVSWFSVLESASVSAASSTQTTTVTGIGNAVELTYPVEVTVTAELALTCDIATSTMLTNSAGGIAGLSGGVATSSRSCLVKTNNSAGWIMTTHASDTPALVHNVSSTVNFPDANTTPASWSSPAANTSKFGFNASGTYADAAFSGNLYRGFAGQTPVTIATSNGPTDTTGAYTAMNYKSEVGSAASQMTGTYRAYVTITAYMQ